MPLQLTPDIGLLSFSLYVAGALTLELRDNESSLCASILRVILGTAEALSIMQPQSKLFFKPEAIGNFLCGIGSLG